MRSACARPPSTKLTPQPDAVESRGATAGCACKSACAEDRRTGDRHSAQADCARRGSRRQPPRDPARPTTSRRVRDACQKNGVNTISRSVYDWQAGRRSRGRPQQPLAWDEKLIHGCRSPRVTFEASHECRPSVFAASFLSQTIPTHPADYAVVDLRPTSRSSIARRRQPGRAQGAHARHGGCSARRRPVPDIRPPASYSRRGGVDSHRRRNITAPPAAASTSGALAPRLREQLIEQGRAASTSSRPTTAAGPCAGRVRPKEDSRPTKYNRMLWDER